MRKDKWRLALVKYEDLLGAFFIPSLLLLLVYIIFGVYPFGQRSILVLDLNGQYVFYFEALKDALLGDKSLLYSWSRNLGGEMLGLTAYYLASPFSLLLLLFPDSLMTESLLFLTLFKIGLCGLSMAVYLKYAQKAGKNSVLMFAVLYALMAYPVVQVMNVMWIDGMIFLPLIVWGIERLVVSGGFKMFVCSLALMFIANFYIGFMVSIFTLLYFIYYLLVYGKARHWRQRLRQGMCFAGYALLATACAAFVILPAYYSLGLGKLEFSSPKFEFVTQFQFLDFFAKLLPCSYDTVRPEGLPIVYCGVLSLLLLPLFYLNPRFTLKEKAGSAILLTVLFFSMQIKLVDLVWHGFQTPNWLPYRYSFVFSFLVLVLACRAWERIGDVSRGRVLRVPVILAAALITIDKFSYEFLSAVQSIWLALLCLLLYTPFLLAANKEPLRKTLATMLCVLVFVEVFLNSWSMVGELHADVVYSNRESYRKPLDALRPVTERLREEDSGFYRLEKTFQRSTNDALALGTNGLAHSSSTLNAQSIAFLKALGFSAKSHWVKYYGATMISDALLGIKYVLTKDALPHEYQYLWQDGEIEVYENPYALPIAFLADQDVLALELENDRPFALQNRLLSALVGEEGLEFFTPVEIKDVRYTDVNKVANYGTHEKYVPTTDSKDGRLEFVLEGQGNQKSLYAYFPTTYQREVNLWLDTKLLGKYFAGESNYIIPLGAYPRGEKVSLSMAVLEHDLLFKEKQFYAFNEDLFREKIAVLQEQAGDLIMKQTNRLELEVNATGEQILFTSIPYEPGWRVYVDGAKADTLSALDSLLAVRLAPGTHKVVLSFWPWQVTVGCVVSFLGVAVLFVLIVREKRRRIRELWFQEIRKM